MGGIKFRPFFLMMNYPTRNEVIGACIEHQQKVLSVAKYEMDSVQSQCNDYGANVDRYDAYRTKLMRQRDMYARQLANAMSTIAVLEQIIANPKPSTITHGAIVITSKQRFLLSVGIGKFMVGEQVWYAISAQTPVFMALKGRCVGDVVTFNGISQEILAIY